MTAPDPQRQQRIDDAVRRIHTMNDQLAVFYAARAAAFSTSSDQVIAEAIREMYRDFDRKHPDAPQSKGAEQ
ncbi:MULTISPECIES: hypothetical protein [Mycobacterium avium complex (MAC)]|uniref:Uncharacterized protein n=1 Tax=Mycobacterium timonense TaxID=701043 RepID=A0ABX3TSQ0_9MYCO|nr:MULTISPECIES: hypothetical protein [Mycobacterium avium complex (MAC)]ETB16133.1 hypothetical protein O983_27740 [Mycobacterium avium 09-5983]ETB44370.1 hypothetical protein N602_03180 [Mycobacterium avium subsp. hominissuis 10-5606]MBZ4500162.1 hypothetical protein [Mycobacterium avium subsp. hominissuis]MBZ4547773.1 hypothetical protein [Mycobacterium avium subsp. hominissuis]MBZ4600342.1 hypothetical protein [Mycobacterium avium subsp. hominissuis]